MAKVVANDRLGVNTDLKSLIKFTALMVAISLPGGCGIGEATAPNADGAGSQQTTAKAWEQEGSRLRNAKLAARHAAGTSTGVAAENLDDYVYRSAPINIEGAGTYILKFGPVSSEFNWPTRPAALAFSLPDVTFAVTPAVGRRTRIVRNNGGRYLEVAFEVKDLEATYQGYYGWVY